MSPSVTCSTQTSSCLRYGTCQSSFFLPHTGLAVFAMLNTQTQILGTCRIKATLTQYWMMWLASWAAHDPACMVRCCHRGMRATSRPSGLSPCSYKESSCWGAVVASEKGVVVGRLTYREDGDLIDCQRMGVGGKAIPPNVDKVCCYLVLLHYCEKKKTQQLP